MKTNLLLLIAFFMAITFNACNQEEDLLNSQENQEEGVVGDDPDDPFNPELQLEVEKSLDALARSIDLSLAALPANIHQIEISPAGAINPNGESRVVIASGTFTTSMLVKAQDLGSGENLATGTITGNGMMGFAALTIPPYNADYSYPSRAIGFFYWGSTNQWELFHFETQAPNGNGTVKPPVFSLNVTESGDIPAAGAVISTVLTGNFTTNTYDRLYIRAYSPTTGQQVSTTVNYFQGTTERVKNLTIKENNNIHGLTILFQYSLDNGVTWITYHTTSQSASQVGERKGLSNSYIVKPNGKPILIPVKRANEYTKSLGREDAIKNNTKFTAELVWTDHHKGIDKESNIREIAAVGTGKDGYIMVVPGSGQGNAVVSARVNGVVVWSWHIWVTKEEPVSDHIASNGKGLMDRNLGAISKTPYSSQTSSYGLLYQWGRKDPFPGSAIPASDTEPTLYYAGGSFKLSIEPAPATTGTGNNMDNSIRNPVVFYTQNVIPADWYSTRYDGPNSPYPSRYHNDALWDLNGKKTIYDPCPEGWRVPYYSLSNSPWSTFTNSNFKWNGYGRIYDNKSYYPAAGYRSNSNGKIMGTGSLASVWSATPERNYGYGLQFYNIKVTDNNSGYRASGSSVRCMQE